METRERLMFQDHNGVITTIGDLVYWRWMNTVKDGQFPKIMTGVVINIFFDDTVRISSHKDGEIRIKEPKDIIKFTKEEEMLWLLENS